MSRSIIIRNLGRQPYEAVWGAMKEFTDRRGADTDDELWVVEHDPVFTQGLAGKAEHVLNPGRIPIVQSDRGGQVTYHGPGQVVIYPLLDLNRSGLGVRCLVDRLEQAVIGMLAEAGIEAVRRDGAPGVYVDQAKIASIGLKVRRGCTYHGLAFNVAMDLTPFSLINPCGFSGLSMTQLSELVPGATWGRAAEQLSTAICQCLGYYQESGDPPVLATIATDSVIP